MKTKVLKIIQIIYDILSLGFIVFVVCAMSLAPKSEGHSNNDVVETKARDNIYSNAQYTYLTFGEFGSTEFLVNLINNYYNRGDILGSWSYEDFVLGDPLDFDTGLLAEPIYFVDFNEGQFDTEEWYQATGAYVTHIRIQAEQLGDYCFSIVFKFTSSAGPVWTFDTRLFFYEPNFLPLDTGRTNIVSSEVTYVFTEGSSRMWDSSVAGLRLPNIEVINRILPRIELQYNDANFQNGYQKGLEEGTRIGKREGYDKGYIDGSTGIETNAFSVMTQAFQAISGIFNINVLPNLPLWVLVFVPLIVVVVIVVVKMIKG